MHVNSLNFYLRLRLWGYPLLQFIIFIQTGVYIARKCYLAKRFVTFISNIGEKKKICTVVGIQMSIYFTITFASRDWIYGNILNRKRNTDIFTVKIHHKITRTCPWSSYRLLMLVNHCSNGSQKLPSLFSTSTC